MKIAKNQVLKTALRIDMRGTGGPNIPKGTPVTVKIRRHDGRLWVDVHGYGQRHLHPTDLV